jgi:hypothetical protein
MFAGGNLALYTKQSNEINKFYLLQMLKLHMEACFNRNNRFDFSPSCVLRFENLNKTSIILLSFIDNMLPEDLSDKKDVKFINESFNICLIIIRNCLTSWLLHSETIRQPRNKDLISVISKICNLIATIPKKEIWVISLSNN